MMLSLEHVSKWFGAVQVLSDINLEVSKGEVVVVCGPSGSGKSTMLRCINRLEVVQQGKITVDGIGVTDPSVNLNKLRSRVGVVFQAFNLYPHMTVLRNLTLAPMLVNKVRRAEAEDMSRDLLNRVGLLVKASSYPSQLSGGQQQRVAIARALVMNPKLMLFDEPTSALDPELTSEVLDVMGDLAKDDMTMIIVTHEMGFARKVANRIVFMADGAIVEHGRAEEFFSNPKEPRSRQFLSKILPH
jgi:polar amino acid transport system ATP-binding protein